MRFLLAILFLTPVVLADDTSAQRAPTETTSEVKPDGKEAKDGAVEPKGDKARNPWSDYQGAEQTEKADTKKQDDKTKTKRTKKSKTTN